MLVNGSGLSITQADLAHSNTQPYIAVNAWSKPHEWDEISLVRYN